MTSAVSDVRREDTLFISLAEKWLERNRIRWKESTYSKYYRIINIVLSESLGKLRVSEITSNAVQGEAERMILNGLSVPTVKDYVLIINCVLRYANDENYSCQSRVNVCLPQRAMREMDVLSSNEQYALVSTLKRNMDPVKLGIMFALYTGVRCGELCALQWNDIDLSRRCVFISKTMQRIQNFDGQSEKTKIVIMPPKTPQSMRRIPLPGFLAETMNRFLCKDGEAYLLTGMRNSFIEPRNLQNKFKECLEEAGIQPTNFHTLRHTFATCCIELGFDVKTLSEILGHSSVNTTMNLYVHSSFELKIKNMDKLNQLAADSKYDINVS